MGYRSKVIIGVKSGELSKEFDNILRKHDMKVDDPDGDYLHIHEDPNDKTLYTFNHIKWYESDDWCKEIMDWLEKQDDQTIDRQDGLQNVFCIGLGEDGRTHSEIGDCWDYVEQISEINLID
jgi:hypothetical protein